MTLTRSAVTKWPVRNKSPPARPPAPRGDLLVSPEPVLLQDHRGERIDIGLQHHEQTDEAGQRDRPPAQFALGMAGNPASFASSEGAFLSIAVRDIERRHKEKA
jgi:hypothetical protein